MSISDIADLLGITTTTVYATLREVKVLGVTHYNKRYFLGDLISRLTTMGQEQNDGI